MLFWGWGRKSLQRQVSPETTVVRSDRYLHLMFSFTVTWGYDYAIATLTPVGRLLASRDEQATGQQLPDREDEQEPA